VAIESEVAETWNAFVRIWVVPVLSVAFDKVAIDASSPSTALLSAAAANESSSQENVRAETFSERIMLKKGVSVGVMSEIQMFI
jgi:hypothetical protein